MDRSLSRNPDPRFCALQKDGSLLNPGLKMTVVRADCVPAFRVDWAQISRMLAGPAINWDHCACIFDAWR